MITRWPGARVLAGACVIELGGASGAPPRPPARVFRGGEMNSPPLIVRVRFAAPRRVNRAPLVIELGGASGAPPRPPARVFRGGEMNSPPLIVRVRFAAPRRVNRAPLVIELGGASGAPPRPPARSARVNRAPLAALTDCRELRPRAADSTTQDISASARYKI